MGVFLIPYVYTYGTERTPPTLISACVPFLKRNTKGTGTNTSVHPQMGDFGIHQLKMLFAIVGDVKNK